MSTPQTWKKVLLPTDFSQASLLAAREARQFQYQPGVEVIALHVTEPAHSGQRIQTTSLHEEIDRNALVHLHAWVREHLAASPQVTCEVREGRPAETICAAAEEHGVDAIIIATHGASALRKFLIGSVAEKVVRHATCSVLAVR